MKKNTGCPDVLNRKQVLAACAGLLFFAVAACFPALAADALPCQAGLSTGCGYSNVQDSDRDGVCSDTHCGVDCKELPEEDYRHYLYCSPSGELYNAHPDKCPDTKPGVAVDEYGCETDEIDMGDTTRAPLYRLYNDQYHNHVYTTTMESKEWLMSYGYAYEGIEGYVLKDHVEGSVPLMYLYHPEWIDSYYCIYEDSKKNAEELGYVFQWNEGYVWPTGNESKPYIPGTLPLYELWSQGLKDHFYTTSRPEADRLVSTGDYVEEGIRAYVYASAKNVGGTDADTECIITLDNEELCPDDKSITEAEFQDTSQAANSNLLFCMKRAENYYRYCNSTKQAASSYYEDGELIDSAVFPVASDTYCEIGLPPDELCPNYPDVYKDATFTDHHENANLEESRCLVRAAEYYHACGNTKSVTATFYADGKPVNSVGYPDNADTECIITLPEDELCPTEPVIGQPSFNDYGHGADVIEGMCLIRAAEYYNWCNNTKPVTASFYDGGELVSSISYPDNADTECIITLPAGELCPAYPQIMSQSFNDYAMGSDMIEPVCMVRAAQYYSTCQNTRPVTASFYRDGKLENSLTYPSQTLAYYYNLLLSFIYAYFY